MTSIALDPGISTGVAIHVQIPEVDHTINSISYNDKGYATTVIKQVTDIWNIIDHHEPEVIICENFQSGGLISTYGQQTLRLIGAIEVICFRQNIKFMLQYPSEIHNNPGLMQKAKLLLKQIKVTPIVHEIDAMAHLLLYEDRVLKGIADKMLERRQRQI